MTSPLSNDLAVTLEALGYVGSDGLFTITGDSSPEPTALTSRNYLWRDLDYKVGLDAAFFHDGVPLVGFTDAPPGSGLLQLRKRLWNYGRVPLLIVATPGGFEAYNGLQNPILPDNAQLGGVSNYRQSIAADLSDAFMRRNVEAGSFSSRFRDSYQNASRVDQGLFSNLRYLRRNLGNQGKEFRSALDTFIGACITASYLADRDVLDRARLEELARVGSIDEALQRGQTRTTALFRGLAERFNGDVFGNIESAIAQLDDNACRAVASLLRGDDLPTGQGSLWPYDFRVLPSDLVTGVYEQLLEERQRQDAAFYTPRAIVDLILDEVIPWSAEEVPTLIDLACGSGAFLTEAFRRLAFRARWSKGSRLNYPELRDLLTRHIFGVDSNPDAANVAAFGTYLALLEEVHPPTIWTEVTLPALIETNIVVSDAFNEHSLRNRKFDAVVSNPPWKEALTKSAESFIRNRHAPVANRQIAEAFVWLASDVLRPGGKLGLVLPAKGVLHNRSDAAQEFRTALFQQLDVRSIVDLSPIRRELFPQAIGPSALLMADKPTSEQNSSLRRDLDELIHITVHPRPLTKVSGALAITPEDINIVKIAQARARSDIWKTLVWGTPRDLDFLDHIRAKYPTLGEVQEQHGWRLGQGFKAASQQAQQDASFLIGMPVVNYRSVAPLKEPEYLPERFSSPTLHRPREDWQYRAPQVITRRTLPQGKLAATFLALDAAYSSELIGLVGPPIDADFLRVVAAVISSSYGNYWQFMTSASWGVERGTVERNELLAMPIPRATLEEVEPDLLRNVLTLAEPRSGNSSSLLAALDEAVFNLFHFTPAERRRITEGVTGKLAWFDRGTSYQLAATDEDINKYASVISSSLKRSMPDVDVRYGFERRGNYVTCWLSFTDERTGTGSGNRILDANALDRLLEDNGTATGTTGMISLPAAFLIDEDTVYLVKTVDRDRWSYDAALNDATRIFATLVFGA